uniref:DRBM domain-containing protein n=1 Tax=Stegastes partitus TaxID=144197 RepID=A0A3B4ZP13_9TELE
MVTGNYVAKLNEFAQKSGLVPRYEELESGGPDHDKRFTQRVVLDGKPYPSGAGKTKKEAKQNAAQKALRSLFSDEHQDSADSTENAAEASAPVEQKSINYICWLNEHGQKNRLNIKPLCCHHKYPEVCGKTKREAKELAAKLVYDDKCGNISLCNPSGSQTNHHCST